MNTFTITRKEVKLNENPGKSESFEAFAGSDIRTWTAYNSINQQE